MTTEDKVKADLQAVDVAAKAFVNREVGWVKRHQLWLIGAGAIVLVILIWKLV